MMRLFLTTIIFNFLFILPSYGALTIDVSEPTLEITTGFTGDTLTLFGTANPAGDIVIIVKGPENDTTIRRRENFAGLWIGSDSVKFENVPGYYNVASSRSMSAIADFETRLEYGMGINSLVFQAENKKLSPDKGKRFLEALIQDKQLAGLYSLTPDAITYLNESLFKTRIFMPANVPVGSYTIQAFLINEGVLIDQASAPFEVEQIGLAGNVHNFAIEKPFFYGLTVIIIALLSSVLAVTLLRRD
jgi:uncharacterized protein (TIGR02186 family)